MKNCYLQWKKFVQIKRCFYATEKMCKLIEKHKLQDKKANNRFCLKIAQSWIAKKNMIIVHAKLWIMQNRINNSFTRYNCGNYFYRVSAWTTENSVAVIGDIGLKTAARQGPFYLWFLFCTAQSRERHIGRYRSKVVSHSRCSFPFRQPNLY